MVKTMERTKTTTFDKILLRKRALIETVNDRNRGRLTVAISNRGVDQLKNMFQIEHLLHRSIWKFLVNLMAGLIVYSYLPHKPSRLFKT